MAERTNYREDVASRRSTLEDRMGSTNSSAEGQPRSEHIRRDIESTRASLDQKLDLLENKVRGVQTNVKQALDVNHHFAQHPWAMLGASVAAGFALGMLTGGEDDDHHEERRYRESWRERAGGWADRARGMFEVGEPARGGYGAYSGSGRHEVQRHDIFDTLKLAAGAAITDMARQAISRYVPALGEQLEKVWRERGLTPTAAASALFSRRQEPPEPPAGHGQAATGSSGGAGYTESSGSASHSASSAPAPDLARDYDPTVEPTSGTLRGEMASRS